MPNPLRFVRRVSVDTVLVQVAAVDPDNWLDMRLVTPLDPIHVIA
jgi:hypothetical protein